MADVFEDHPQLAPEREKLWHLIEATPMLDWLLLTKRPEHMQRMVPQAWHTHWPRNVWAMTSVEDQQRAKQRIPLLLDVPAVVRGLSVEPLIAPVDLSAWLADIQWVIVGGESGHHAREMHPDWVRAIRDQCLDYDVPFFFKQWGNLFPVTYGNNGSSQIAFERMNKKTAGRELDGHTWDEFPIVAHDEEPLFCTELLLA